MPSIVNIGSINVDHVYRVDNFVRPGQTLAATKYSIHAGGKGANQSIALARAGATVVHYGKIGADGQFVIDQMSRDGVNVDYIQRGAEPTGHAIIQVDNNGQNSIIVYGGANVTIGLEDAQQVLKEFGPEDFLLLQNEISNTGLIMQAAAKQGLKIVFNPSPMNAEVLKYPLDLVDYFILNETEAKELGKNDDVEAAIGGLRSRFSKAHLVITLGERGAVFLDNDGSQGERFPAVKVDAVDTTAAGDTFTGYFLASILKGQTPAAAIQLACRAAALCVTKVGAIDSVPRLADLE